MTETERAEYNRIVLEVDEWRTAAEKILKNGKCLGAGEHYWIEWDDMVDLRKLVG